MKKILVLLPFVLLSIKGFSQNVKESYDKSIEWDVDDNSIKKELPYNQTICFILKSKKIALNKIDDVFILEHKGKKNINSSLEYYSKHDSLIGRKFYAITIGDYDTANKTLKVIMAEDLSSLSTSKRKPTYVLQPSKRYSLILFTSNPESATNKLLDKVKIFLDSVKTKADTNRLRSMYEKIKENYTNIRNAIDNSKTSPRVFPEYFYDTIPDDLIKNYARIVYNKLDANIDSLIKDTAEFKNSLKAIDVITDSVTLFIEKSLSTIIAKGGCISQLPCEINKCTLFKYLIAIKNRDTTTFKSLILGAYRLSDLTNPLFKRKSDLGIGQMIINVDSSILQLTNLKLYLYSLFINDCKTYNCCDSNKKYFNSELINKELVDYMRSIDSLILKMKLYKPKLLSLEEAIATRIKAIRNQRYTYVSLQINEANTFTYGLEPRSKLTIIPVFGYAFYGFQKGFNSFTPYTGILVSFAPTNDTISFNLLKHKTLAQRLTFFTGVTLTSLKENNKRDNLFSNGSNLIVGLGFKLNHIVALNSGAIIFRKEDPNPFISKKTVAATPFLALSLNLKVKTLFEGLMGLIPGK